MEIDKKDLIPVPSSVNPRLIIIGGGFAGIKIAKGLRKAGLQVVLFDRNNYHTFQPLLYQVATAGLEPDSIAGPLRQQLESYKDYYFRMAQVFGVDPDKKVIFTEIGALDYDYLVIACGSKTNYFGNESIMENSFPLKQIPQALDLRSHILQNFEEAVITRSGEKLQSQMNVVIVGGGPTGVEVAGALGELKKNVLPKDYPELNLERMKIYLVEGQGRLLGGMSEVSGERALKYLKRFDVNVRLNTLVKFYDGVKATLDDGTEIETHTLVWAAGVEGNIIDGLDESAIERGRILVDHFNRVVGYDDIFAVGDVAMMKDDAHPSGHPMLAQVAMQQGDNLAHNLKKLIKHEAMKPFSYNDKGSMATIGRNKAVVDLSKNLKFGGFFAWLLWMFIHLISIIGLRNKLVIFSNWVWNYFTYDRGTRLIIRRFTPKFKIRSEQAK
ncbi:MAG: NAD(P)/FAD-dependent oxidoreductase [Bacteroidota bacterium]